MQHGSGPLLQLYRVFGCERCRQIVSICRACDRNQRYCSEDCRDAARRDSLRRSGQRYQASEAGRQRNAERQRRWRERQPAKRSVTVA